MAPKKDGTKVTIEKTKDRVVLKIDSMEIAMSAALARELGDKLYKCGCDVAATADQ